MELLTVISFLAILFTILSFSTGLQICARIWRKKSTTDVPAFPFLAGTFCTFLSLRYALIIQDGVQIFINCVGFMTFSLYIIFYYHFTLNRSIINKKVGCLIALMLLIELASKYPENPRVLVGLIASTSGIIFSGSPLVSIFTVVQKKSAAILPFWLILSSAIVSSLWLTYGLLIDDIFIQVTNSLAAVLSGLQLSLFVLYPAQDKSKESEKTILMEDLKERIDL